MRTTARAMGVEILDALDVLAVIFGVLFTVRKLDVSRREAQDFPGVDPGAFESWRRRESAVYTLGSLACVLKVVLDAGFLLTVAPHLEFGGVRVIGATIDLLWAALVIVTLVRGSKARQERRRLGIVLQ